MKNRTGCWVAGIIGLVGLVVFGCGISGFLIFQATVGSDAAKLDTELKRATAEGIPTTPQELRDSLRTPEDQNGKDLFLRATKLFAKIPDAELKKLPTFVRTGETADRPSAQAFALFKPVRKKLEQGVTKPKLIFDRNWEAGPDLLFPELSALKRMTQFLAVDARIKSKEGDVEGAMDDFELAEKLGNRLSHNRSLIESLVTLAIHAITNRPMMIVMKEHPGDVKMLRRVQMLAEQEELPDLSRAFGTELTLARIGLESGRIWDDPDSPEQSKRIRQVLQTPPLRKALEARVVGNYLQIIEQMPADRNDWVGVIKLLKAREAAIDVDHSLMGEVTQVVVLDLSQLGQAFARVPANQRVTLIACRLLIDHAAGKPYPNVLPISGLKATDPFDGKPLRYKREGNGFKVYSVDVDGIDDGGVPTKGKQRGDIVFQIGS